MKFFQVITYLAITAFAFAQARPKFETSVLKHAVHCNEKVNLKSTIKLAFSKKDLKSNTLLEYKNLQVKSGEATVIKDVGLDKEVLGMCVGEIRRFAAPSKSELSNEPVAYEVEVLEIENPPFFTPLFWVILGGISVTYVAVSILAKREDESKDQTRKKAE